MIKNSMEVKTYEILFSPFHPDTKLDPVCGM